MAKGKYSDWINPEGLALISGWARDGLIDSDIAHNMGIAYSTFRSWKEKYPEMAAALRASKMVVDRRVESSLLKKAMGYVYEEKTFATTAINPQEYAAKVQLETDLWDEQHPTASAEERDAFILTIPKTKEVLEKRVEKYAHPDTTAIIFWLKNRKAEWSDKKIIQHAGALNVKKQMGELSVEELRRLAQVQIDSE